ncbi:LOW QUALITY PROTEIN: hypothetical protein KUTeg_016846 [Tegillarca granosa]|uniref:TatD DNase domain containing 2 n=1 Tax=Tegillarca granosa TaxID=220873 RepID=A0ABQ9EPN4_TEGGR|nr:LOW QUALITY PROTEIN: hypothetical protein KUTeg_016846 [Tegillarca granosa]
MVVAEPEPKYLEVFDSHFHLDRVLRDCGLSRGGTVEDVLNQVPVRPEEKCNLIGGVQVYCDPKTYPSSRTSFGSFSWTVGGSWISSKTCRRQSIKDYLTELKVLLDCPKVVALGEIGMDHTEPTEYWHLQLNLLQEVLPLLRKNRVLVIHCRGMKGDCGTEVYMLLLHYLRKAVSTHHPIHLHCFTEVVGGISKDLLRIYQPYLKVLGKPDPRAAFGNRCTIFSTLGNATLGTRFIIPSCQKTSRVSWSFSRTYPGGYNGTKQVEIIGLEDKRQTTALLTCTMSGDLLPPQLL